MASGQWSVVSGWWGLLVVFVATFLLVPLVRVYALKAGLVDEPGPRRSHTEATPRGGGMAMILVLIPALYWLPLPVAWKIAVLPALVAMALLGFVDDHRPLAVRWRLLTQFACAVWMVVWLGGVPALDFGDYSLHAPWLWTPLAVLALMWLINLYNFMDGSNGLAAGQGLFVALVFALLFYLHGETAAALIAMAVAAVCAGFLPWNLSGKIFMGDTGSLSLGLMVGVLALMGLVTGSVSVWTSLLVTSVFVVDATATLARQLVRGQEWYTAHRQHAYQRLIASGSTHGAVLTGYVLINIVLVCPAVWLVVEYPRLDMVVALAVCTVLLLGWMGIGRLTRGQSTHDNT